MRRKARFVTHFPRKMVSEISCKTKIEFGSCTCRFVGYWALKIRLLYLMSVKFEDQKIER
ncbi:hypothetical protein HanPSC8_Chr12g0522941 [Helianthus annuus]|nr:hypothetical protein HanPSC8_Chr12g0522941 [Helianthus annuus]